MGFLTTALVLAALEKDPRHYSCSFLDIFRGICEGITLLLITISLLVEFHTIYLYVRTIKQGNSITLIHTCRWRAMYIKEFSFFFFSYITVLTALLLYTLIPLRAVGSNIQWIFASLAYIAYSLVVFRFLLNIR